MTAPVPRNVRIEHADGRVTPVEVAYAGKRPARGGDEVYILDVWSVVTPVDFRIGDRVAADDMPELAQVRLGGAR